MREPDDCGEHPCKMGRLEDFVPAETLAKACDVFGSREKAEVWMNRRAIGLNGERPIEMLQTVHGIELVHDFLTRLEYCVYS